jgi:DNA-binding transcriptional LysR family regulator
MRRGSYTLWLWISNSGTLRCLVAIVDSGSFTDAAIDLGISQAAVSRNLKALEQVLGVRVLHRTSRNVTPTTAGVHALAQARQVLAAADNLVAEATTGHTRLRIGHAWAAMGRHTRELPVGAASGSPRRARQSSTGVRAWSSGHCATHRRSPCR